MKNDLKNHIVAFKSIAWQIGSAKKLPEKLS